jgi:hypothetical protein
MASAIQSGIVYPYFFLLLNFPRRGDFFPDVIEDIDWSVVKCARDSRPEVNRLLERSELRKHVIYPLQTIAG